MKVFGRQLSIILFLLGFASSTHSNAQNVDPTKDELRYRNYVLQNIEVFDPEDESESALEAFINWSESKKLNLINTQFIKKMISFLDSESGTDEEIQEFADLYNKTENRRFTLTLHAVFNSAPTNKPEFNLLSLPEEKAIILLAKMIGQARANAVGDSGYSIFSAKPKFDLSNEDSAYAAQIWNFYEKALNDYAENVSKPYLVQILRRAKEQKALRDSYQDILSNLPKVR